MSSSSKMDSQLTGMWVNFFTAAGIPADMSASYALTFAENRIQNDMLLELNKEYLRDMGITRMGDVIAILRHSKQVHESAARDRVLSSASSKVPVAAVAGRLTTAQAKPSSPASRILEHYTRNTQDASPPRAATKRKTNEPAPTENVTETKKSRLIRFGNPAQALGTEGPSNKNVFARLGTAEARPAAAAAAAAAAAKPIFSRLGAKTEPSVADVPIPKDALKYEGILKSPPLKKVISVTALRNNVRTINLGTMRADETPVNIKEKLAMPKLATKSVKFSNKVEYKEIDNVKPKFTSVFNKPERRLSMPEGSTVKMVKASPSSSGATVNLNATSNSVKARLGNKNANNLTITRNVFNRLGV